MNQMVFATQEVVHIALSSTISKPLESLCIQFAEQTKYKCKIIAAPTGHLYAHIMHGAKYDVLISSDESYSQALINANKAEVEGRFMLAIGKVVLWSSDTSLSEKQLKEKLMDENISVAIANPSTTPYGVAAKEVLQDYNIWHRMQARIVFGRDLAQTFQLLQTEKVPIGFISLSQLPAAVRENKQYWEPEANTYQPVLHEIVMLKSAAGKKAVQAFVEFMRSKQACLELQKTGYQCCIKYLS